MSGPVGAQTAGRSGAPGVENGTVPRVVKDGNHTIRKKDCILDGPKLHDKNNCSASIPCCSGLQVHISSRKPTYRADSNDEHDRSCTSSTVMNALLGQAWKCPRSAVLVTRRWRVKSSGTKPQPKKLAARGSDSAPKSFNVRRPLDIFSFRALAFRITDPFAWPCRICNLTSSYDDVSMTGSEEP